MKNEHYTRLFMAPYSKNLDTHLWAVLYYPPDTDTEFLKQYYAIMQEYEQVGNATTTQPAPSNSPTNAVVSEVQQPNVPPSVILYAPPGPYKDLISEPLYNAYIRHQVKLERKYVEAAITLVALNARNSGFWRTVLEDFKKFNSTGFMSPEESSVLDLLTALLAHDGAARASEEYHLRTPNHPPRAAISSIQIGPEVLDAVIERAKTANGNQLDRFVRAVVASGDLRGNNFLINVLRVNTDQNSRITRPPATNHLGSPINIPDSIQLVSSGPGYSPEKIYLAQFHAARCLAGRGEKVGVEWLIAYHDAAIDIDIPYGEHPGRQLSANCALALMNLSGLKSDMPRFDWERWWQANQERFIADRKPLFTK